MQALYPPAAIADSMANQAENAPVIPRALLDSIPRDQAMGLRLICLARAAAAIHMAQACAPTRGDCAPGPKPAQSPPVEQFEVGGVW